MEGTVIVREGNSIRVLDRNVLGEGEVDGVVGDGEGRELNSVDGDFGVFRFENCEEDDEDYDNKKD